MERKLVIKYIPVEIDGISEGHTNVAIDETDQQLLERYNDQIDELLGAYANLMEAIKGREGGNPIGDLEVEITSWTKINLN